MSWSSLIPAAAGIASAFIGSNAAGKAADAQAESNAASLALQERMYNQNREDLAPYRQVGTSALNTLAGQVNQPFTQTPGYQFAFDEGRRAIDSSASARGLLNSGARLRELTRYGTGMAEQGYGQYTNRLASLAGIGQTATGQGVNNATQYGQAAGQTLQNTGTANASGAVGAANAITGGLNNANSAILYALGGYGK